MRIHPFFSYNGFQGNEADWTSFISSRIEQAPEWEQPFLLFIREWLNDNIELEVQTSGSTGVPKAWKVQKLAMVNSATLTANYFNRKEGTTALLCLPGNFIAGKMMLVRAMTFGWSLTVIRPSSTPLTDIETPFDFAAFTPMQVVSLNDDKLRLLSRFGAVILGGAAVSETWRKRLSEFCDNLYETYGMAETLSHIAVRKITSEQSPFQALEGIDLSVDEVGRLRIHAPHIEIDVIQTNDVVELLDTSSFFYKGRYDRMINSGGVKLFAEVIERKLEPVIHVPFAIGAVHDELLGQKVILYLESNATIDLEQLRVSIKQVLNRFEVPKEIRFLDKLERTESGKIKVIR
jgi:O-succinylbenzoic acid--CoA ligase